MFTRRSQVFESRAYQGAVIGLLIFYAVLILVKPPEISSWYVVHAWLYRVTVTLLVIDVLARALFDWPKTLWSEKTFWFGFDVVTTVAAFIPGYEPFRAARLLRILSQWNETRDTITPLLVAVWQAKKVLIIIAVLMFVNTLIGHDAFKEAMPERFGNVGISLLTSISLVIGDDFWLVYSVAFATHAAAALFHVSLSLFSLLFIISLVIYRVFKSFEDNE